MWKSILSFFRSRSLILVLATCFVFVACGDELGDSELRQQLEDLSNRVTSLETLCQQINTNISSMQTIVNALEQQDYITGVTPITEGKVVIGYTITFAKNKAITIYYGEDGADGKDGQNGTDGKDGISPQIGIAKDADGQYYWMLNGKWLVDNAGNKMKVSGTGGKDGVDGTYGKDGEDGTDGKDGITPQVKIEDNHWWVSIDKGATWQDLGEIVSSSTFFQEVINKDDCLIIILADGSKVELPKIRPLAIHFDCDNLMVMALGGYREIDYTITNADKRTMVEVISSPDLKVKVIPQTFKKGRISIQVLDSVTEDSKVMALVR